VRALLLRFYRSTGFVGLVVILVLGLWSIAYAVGRGSAPPISRGLAISLAGVAVAVAGGATRYGRSSATHDYAEILIPLEHSEREYCVVLRPFGRDGEIVLPKTRRIRLFMPNMTMEQAVAKAVRRALHLETYAIVDQTVSFAPPGPTFMRASNDEWKVVAQRLIRGARSILLVLTPGREIGEGFGWEIEQIVDCALQSRVIIVLPPCDQGVRAYKEARRQASGLLVRLGQPFSRAGLRPTSTDKNGLTLPEHTILARPSTEMAEPRTWAAGAGGGPITVDQLEMEAVQRVIRWVRRQPQPQSQGTETKPHRPRRKRTAVTDADYVGALVEALDEIDIELSEHAVDEYARDHLTDEATFTTERRPENQALLDADHHAAIAANRARWGPEAPIRAEIRRLNHRIRDRERMARPTLQMTRWDRLGYRCIMVVSAAATSLFGWIEWDAWQAGVVGLGGWALMMAALTWTARRSLPSLHSDRRELQDRLGCGVAVCARCRSEVDRPRNDHLFWQFFNPC
jgi:hypothetical protein